MLILLALILLVTPASAQEQQQPPIITALQSQRNAAMDQLANAMVTIQMLREENAKLKADAEKEQKK